MSWKGIDTDNIDWDEIRWENFEWDIRNKGWSWSGKEFEDKAFYLTPRKIEMSDGKLFNNDQERMLMLAMLLENMGADAAVSIGGNRFVWQEAIRRRKEEYVPHNESWSDQVVATYLLCEINKFVPTELLAQKVELVTDKMTRTPDLMILSEECADELSKRNSPTITSDMHMPLLIAEVVGWDWRDDYSHKLAEYEKLGVPEYWIVDHKAAGGRTVIGNLKSPAITVCNLVDEEYELNKFFKGDKLKSQVIPELEIELDKYF